MTDRGRLPSRWTYAVIATWGVGGFLLHVAVRDVAVGLAAVVSGSLVALALLTMGLTRLRRPWKPTRPAKDVDILPTSSNQLFELAIEVGDRVQGWTTVELDAEARAHAVEAQKSIQDIIMMLQKVVDAGSQSEDVLRRLRLSLRVISGGVKYRPNDAAGWYLLMNSLKGQHGMVRDAVGADGTTSATSAGQKPPDVVPP